MIWEMFETKMEEQSEAHYKCGVCLETVPPGVPKFTYGPWAYCPACISLWSAMPDGEMRKWWIKHWLNSMGHAIEHFEVTEARDRYKRRAAKLAKEIGMPVEGPIEYINGPISFEELYPESVTSAPHQGGRNQ